ncbi:hypothetical protein LA080_007320 [Diaporthe eres]|uniref:Alpha-galactosidase A n=1 Tax=Diaporthe vaccinii TaxID=105482 RepID=A0ABR4F5H6_9PEZI|nr:hypothetical protein LA080_007320 [Diaporthe eres]
MGLTPQSPQVLSMEAEPTDDSYFRIRCGGKVKYVIVAPGTLDSEDLWLPLYSLPPLPYHEDGWNVAHVSRAEESQKLHSSLEVRPLPGVTEIWHPQKIDVLSLKRVEILTIATFECTWKEEPTPSGTYIAKIARFEWEIPRIELETHAYRLLQDTHIAPKFLGHIHEQGRVIGFLLEKLDGRYAGTDDLPRCTEVLTSLHKLGLLHGDVNRHNFLIGDVWTKMIDFETCRESQDQGLKKSELLSLPAELKDESGRGAGFIAVDKED